MTLRKLIVFALVINAALVGTAQAIICGWSLAAADWGQAALSAVFVVILYFLSKGLLEHLEELR